MNPSHKHYHRIAWAAVLLALAVIVFGGFVRLSNAGLSCPDWPTCYGQVTWPVHDHEVEAANAAFERPVESHKAWREQVHRHLAASLGVLVLVLALLAARRRPGGIGSLLGASALVALSIPAYTGVGGLFASNHAVSLALVIAGELILLLQAIRWSNSDGARHATILLMVGLRMFRTPGLRWWATVLVVLLLAQVTLGILNVKLALPLWTAVSHVAGAALLLFVIVGLLARLRAPE